MVNGKSVLHPFAFLSEKMTSAECNYGIGNKELLAIVACLEKWHMYLHGVEFTIITTYKISPLRPSSIVDRLDGLGYWPNTNSISYRPGKANGKADALTRRSGDLPCGGDGRGRPDQALIPLTKFLDFPDRPDPEPESDPKPVSSIPSTIFINSAILCNTAIKHTPAIRAALVKDELANAIINALRNGSKHLSGEHSRSVSLGECSIDPNGLLYVYGLLYVPNDENLYREIIYAHHDHPAAGHPGRASIYELVSRNYWWLGMRKTIARYLINCDTFARIKPVKHAPYGLLKPLQVPVIQ